MHYSPEPTTTRETDSSSRTVASLEYAEERFEIVSDGQVDVAEVVALLAPTFAVVEPSDQVTCRVELRVGPLDRSWVNDEKPWRLPPVLQIDHDTGAGFRILRHTPEHKTVFRHPDPDCAELQLDVSADNRHWLLTVEDPARQGLRAIARMVKQLVGHCLMRKGAAIFHASAVSLGGRSYVFYGPRGSGKTSFMFRCCVDLGASFVSDDLLIAWKDSRGRTRVSGWPRRIGISLSAFHPALEARVEGRVLRREQPLGSTWRDNIGRHHPPAERKRLFFDLDEFMSTFEVEYTDHYRPICFIRLNYDVVSPHAASLTPLDCVKDDDSFLNPKLIRHFADYLSLGPATALASEEVRFEEISGAGNRYTLEYGANFFEDFASRWRWIETVTAA